MYRDGDEGAGAPAAEGQGDLYRRVRPTSPEERSYFVRWSPRLLRNGPITPN